MKRCPFCAEEIQDAAIVCKHCGRDLPPAVAVAPENHSVATVAAKKKSSWVARIFFGFLALVLLVGIVNAIFGPKAPQRSRESAASSKTLEEVDVAVNSRVLRITNTGNNEATGKEIEIFINGTPPFTYRAKTTVPVVTADVLIPLSDFTKGGTRFNPITQAVTDIWIGGGGYDYRSLKVQ